MSLNTNFRPLYKQVYDVLVGRLVENYWKPSEPLPSEHLLADELGVSQGTVRKALNQMVAENLLLRRQGKGTYVAEHSHESTLFRFFRFKQSGGESLIPETQLISVESRSANEREKQILDLDDSDSVAQMTRVRSLQGKPTIVENVIQPLNVFPGIDQEPDIPNSLYKLYQENYGISIVEANEELKVITVDKEQAKHLLMREGDPALLVERSSISIGGRVVEWSQAICSTEHFVYAVNLR